MDPIEKCRFPLLDILKKGIDNTLSEMCHSQFNKVINQLSQRYISFLPTCYKHRFIESLLCRDPGDMGKT